MSTVGPVVTVVQLLPDGTMKELTMDMSPSANLLAKTLGGVAGIIGGLPAINVVGVARRDGIIDDDAQDVDDKPSKLETSAKKAKHSAAASKTLARLTGKQPFETSSMGK